MAFSARPIRSLLQIALPVLLGFFSALGFVSRPAPSHILERANRDESLLRRRIAQVRIEWKDIAQLQAELQKTIGVNVNISWNSGWQTQMPAPVTGEIVLNDVTVEQILAKVRNALRTEHFDCFDADGILRIAIANRPRPQAVDVRCYDIRDLIEHPGKWWEIGADQSPDLEDHFVFVYSDPESSEPPELRLQIAMSMTLANISRNHTPGEVLATMIPRLLDPTGLTAQQPDGLDAVLVGSVLVVHGGTPEEAGRVADCLRHIREIDSAGK